MARFPDQVRVRFGLGAWLALWAGALGGCSEGVQLARDIFQDTDHDAGYRLVGAYDASALRTLELLEPVDTRAKPYEYIWIPPANMKKSCGPAKAPDGIGIFEAEAVGNRQLPALALMVERTGTAPPLDNGRVRVALGDDAPEMFLEPAVMPRYLQVVIEGDVAARFKQQVKTQLQTYLCMEHKTGRAWQGGTLDQVRQALLLNPADALPTDEEEVAARGLESDQVVRLADRKFFGGQSEPVAALLGPPQACLKRADDLAVFGARGGQGDTSLALVPADVWGASIVACDDRVVPGGWYVGPRPVTLTLSEIPESGERPQVAKVEAPASGDPKKAPGDGAEGEAGPARASGDPRTWSQLKIKLRAAGELPEQQLIQVEYTGRELMSGPDGKVNTGVLIPEQPMFVSVGEGQLGLIDLVSKMPYRYPTVSDGSDADRFTLLIIPNWQLVEGIRRLSAGNVDRPQASAGEGIQDGVGWILAHPEKLKIMVPGDPAQYDALDQSKAIEWLNIAGVMSGEPLGLRAWGYAAGMLAGRAPVALPGPVTPTWFQVSSAQRATQHSIVLGSFAVLALVLAAGLGRLRDLWTKVPEERVEFWPGPPPKEEGGDDMAELSAGGEEKK